MCVAAGRVPWFVRAGAKKERCSQDASVNLVAVYLGPFLAILAGGMLARALTGGFEWFAVACIVFWIYRREYQKMKWRFTWRGPAIGLFVFGIWMAIEWARKGPAACAGIWAMELDRPQGCHGGRGGAFRRRAGVSRIPDAAPGVGGVRPNIPGSCVGNRGFLSIVRVHAWRAVDGGHGCRSAVRSGVHPKRAVRRGCLGSCCHEWTHRRFRVELGVLEAVVI